MDSSIDHNFIPSLAVGGEGSSFHLSYLFVGLTAEQMCNECGARGEGNIYSDGRCMKVCPPNTLELAVGNSKVCRECLSGMNLVYQKGECVSCGPTATSINGLCLPNTQEVQLNAQIPPLVGITNQNGGTVQCLLPNMYFNGLQCICAEGFNLVSNLCVPIDNTQSATKCFGLYEYFNGFSCACGDGAFLVDSKCVKCMEKSYWNG